MKLNLITNLLLRKFFQSNLDVDVELSLDDSKENAVQIQINVKPKHFNDFAIFYGTKDNKINFSSIFETNVIEDENLYRLFKEEDSIFNEIIQSDDLSELHLFSQIPLENINEEFIDNIIDYLKTEHKLINYLNSISN
jgi:hypothetical protein